MYAHNDCSKYIIKKFDYLFNKTSTSQSYFQPPFELINIDYFDEITINNILIKCIKQEHGAINSLGFIINNKFAYCTDVVGFPSESFNLLFNLKFLIVTGLRETPHVAHAHFDLSFTWIKELKPEHAYLTHLSPESDHDTVLSLCPNGVEPAYDGLVLNI